MEVDEMTKGAMMEFGINEVMDSVRQESEARIRALQGIVSTADSARVFGQPVSSEGYTVIPAAEVASGGGFGSGLGFGGPQRSKMMAVGGSAAATTQTGDETAAQTAQGAGGGGGGGGGGMARPVAAIVIGPDGVRVQPVFDITKLALTALGALGAAVAVTMKLWAKRK
jgi:uncharacterized spore protein YtfJ